MKNVVIDLEMNATTKTFKRELNIGREIIQIGAVVLDENYREIGSFSQLVKPEFNSVVEPKSEKLTGITTEMVKDAPVFEDAIRMFWDWCDSIGDEFNIYQWSENDRFQVVKELRIKEIQISEKHQNMLEYWQDFQAEFVKELGLKKLVSLIDALKYAGVDFEGKQHDALYDARNTAILLNTVRDAELRRKALDKVIEILKPTKVNSCLGEMFDFSQLAIGA